MSLTNTLTLLILASLGLSVPAQAAGEGTVGNGGDVLVCARPGSKRVIELLDFYESRSLRSVEPYFEGAKLTREGILEQYLSRLDRLDPQRGRTYRGMLEEFWREAQFLSGVKLRDVPDSMHVAIPKNCSVEQLVIQQEPNELLYEKRYTFDRDLWEKMSPLQQAGTIMHELIYREQISEGATNSIRARYFNSQLASKAATAWLDLEYQEVLKRSGMRANEYYSDGKPKQLFFPLHRREIVRFGDQAVWAKQVSYRSDGSVQSVWIDRSQEITTSVGTFVARKDSQVETHPNGVVKSIVLEGDSVLKTASGNLTLRAAQERPAMEFHPNGALNWACGSGKLTQKFGPYYYTREFGSSQKTYFNQAGGVDMVASGVDENLISYYISESLHSGQQKMVPWVCPSGYSPYTIRNVDARMDLNLLEPIKARIGIDREVQLCFDKRTLKYVTFDCRIGDLRGWVHPFQCRVEVKDVSGSKWQIVMDTGQKFRSIFP